MNKFRIGLLSALFISTSCLGMEKIGMEFPDTPPHSSQQLRADMTWVDFHQAQTLFESEHYPESAQAFQDLWVNNHNLIALAYLKKPSLSQYTPQNIKDQIESFRPTPLAEAYAAGSELLIQMKSGPLSGQKRKKIKTFLDAYKNPKSFEYGGVAFYIEAQFEPIQKNKKELYQDALLRGEIRACKALKDLGGITPKWEEFISLIERDFSSKLIQSQKPNRISNAINPLSVKGDYHTYWSSLSAHMGRSLSSTEDFLEKSGIARIIDGKYSLSPRFFKDYGSFLLQMSLQESLDHRILLATSFEKGINELSQNKQQAFYWYKKAAEWGYMRPDYVGKLKATSANAFYNLGVAYKDGIGTDINLFEAAKWFERAAELEFEGAPGCLIEILQEDPTLFERLHREVTSRNEKRHQLWVSVAQSALLRILSEKDGFVLPHSSIFEILTYEEHHQKEALALAGMCYETGIGVDKNEQIAAKYYRQYLEDERPFSLAKSEGHISGKLGYLYMERLAFPEGDPDREAVRLFIKGVESEDPLSARVLGFMYHKGRGGLEKNEQESFRLTYDAATMGDVDAMYNLGVKFRDGDGTEQNPRLAYEWFKKAEEKGHLGACNNRISMVLAGEYREDETSESLMQDLQDNVNKGCTESQFTLCLHYLMEKFDTHEYMELLEIAEKNDIPLQMTFKEKSNIALDIPYDLEKGKEIFQRLIQTSDNPAIVSLSELILIRAELHEFQSRPLDETSTEVDSTEELEKDFEDMVTSVETTTEKIKSPKVDQKKTARERKQSSDIQRALKRKRDFIENLRSSSKVEAKMEDSPQLPSFSFEPHEIDTIEAFLEQKGSIKWREVTPILKILEKNGASVKKTKSGGAIPELHIGWHNDHGSDGTTDHGKIASLKGAIGEVMSVKK